MIHVKHRTASGRLDSLWEFDPARRVVDLVIQLGSAEPLTFLVQVCAPDLPRFGAHPLMRLDGESWRILPAYFTALEDEEPTTYEIQGIPFTRSRELILTPRDCRPSKSDTATCPLHEAIGFGTQVVLTNAPFSVEVEMAEMSL